VVYAVRQMNLVHPFTDSITKVNFNCIRPFMPRSWVMWTGFVWLRIGTGGELL
jgi:hypothetical protein